MVPLLQFICKCIQRVGRFYVPLNQTKRTKYQISTDYVHTCLKLLFKMQTKHFDFILLEAVAYIIHICIPVSCSLFRKQQQQQNIGDKP